MLREAIDFAKETIAYVLVTSAIVFVVLFALFIMGANAAEARSRHLHYVSDANGNVIGGRPSGCPYAYCGCGLARYLGIIDKRLNLAWNWARLFPRTYAHAGAAAVRSHHVMLLESQVQGTIWRVVDFNGGRHLSWRHERDTRGYIFVEPTRRMAGL